MREVWGTDAKDQIIPKYGKTPRQMIIDVGTDGCRKAYSNVWSDYVMRRIGETPKGTNIVVTDVRFTNEAEAILNNNYEEDGIIVRVERPGCELGNDIVTTGLYGFDYVSYLIQNDNTLAALENSIGNMLEDFLL